MFIFRVNYKQMNGVVSFTIVLLLKTFPIVFWVTKTEIVGKSYAP